MMTALVLICSLLKTPAAEDCRIENAVDVLKVPGEFHSLVNCFASAQLFLAASRYELGASLYPKIVCGRPHLPANFGMISARRRGRRSPSSEVNTSGD